jgi:hypothetical protein
MLFLGKEADESRPTRSEAQPSAGRQPSASDQLARRPG